LLARKLINGKLQAVVQPRIEYKSEKIKPSRRLRALLLLCISLANGLHVGNNEQ